VSLPLDMPAGIYIAKITQGDKLITTQKVIKN
jgi:hypothetical protein